MRRGLVGAEAVADAGDIAFEALARLIVMPRRRERVPAPAEETEQAEQRIERHFKAGVTDRELHANQAEAGEIFQRGRPRHERQTSAPAAADAALRRPGRCEERSAWSTPAALTSRAALPEAAVLLSGVGPGAPR